VIFQSGVEVLNQQDSLVFTDTDLYSFWSFNFTCYNLERNRLMWFLEIILVVVVVVVAMVMVIAVSVLHGKDHKIIQVLLAPNLIR